MIWLRFIPSSMILAVSVVVALAGNAMSAAEAIKVQPNARIRPSPTQLSKNETAGTLQSMPAAEAQ
jgi:uncharacterized protein (DUF2062 family)